MSALLHIFLLSLIFLPFLITFLLLHIHHTLRPRPFTQHSRTSPRYILAVLGTGGHTTEMISLLNQILTSQPLEKTYRRYIITKGDSRSALLIQELESNLQERCAGEAYAPWFDIVDVPRARRIYQSVWDAPRTCLICLISCISVLIRKPSEPKLLVERSRHVQDAKVEMEPDVQSIKLRHGKNSFKHAYPDIILTNGPATATIVLLAAALLRIIGRRGARDSMRGIYIESWARVKRLSLSAKVCLTLGLCERVVVQWEGLRGLEGWGARWIGWKGRQTEFRGWLVE